MNTLYYGDNLKILRDYIKDESVDPFYLHPLSDGLYGKTIGRNIAAYSPIAWASLSPCQPIAV